MKFPFWLPDYERHVNDYLMSYKKSGSLTSDQYKKIKAIGSRPGILYGFLYGHKAVTDGCLPFRPILLMN